MWGAPPLLLPTTPPRPAPPPLVGGTALPGAPLPVVFRHSRRPSPCTLHGHQCRRVAVAAAAAAAMAGVAAVVTATTAEACRPLPLPCPLPATRRRRRSPPRRRARGRQRRSRQRREPPPRHRGRRPTTSRGYRPSRTSSRAWTATWQRRRRGVCRGRRCGCPPWALGHPCQWVWRGRAGAGTPPPPWHRAVTTVGGRPPSLPRVVAVAGGPPSARGRATGRRRPPQRLWPAAAAGIACYRPAEGSGQHPLAAGGFSPPPPRQPTKA